MPHNLGMALGSASGRPPEFGQLGPLAQRLAGDRGLPQGGLMDAVLAGVRGVQPQAGEPRSPFMQSAVAGLAPGQPGTAQAQDLTFQQQALAMLQNPEMMAQFQQLFGGQSQGPGIPFPAPPPLTRPLFGQLVPQAGGLFA